MTESALSPGSRMGVYEIRELIGAGGMGEVYRAHDTRLRRDVAVKVLSRGFTSDADRIMRFEREARVLASLNHPHVGAIYGLEEVVDRAGSPLRALILEFVAGETLADRIARGPLSLSAAINVARQVADALDAAHEKGIVHRDLKPANIKITPDGTAKVLDFGIAAASTPAPASEFSKSQMVTSEETLPGVILGTVPYMSPEQAKGQEVDKRTDVWAFGCVLFEMLTGQSPFTGATVTETFGNILERDPDWNLLPSAIPAGVLQVLRWTLDKDPKRRLRDIADARVQLEATSSAETQPQPATPLRATRRWRNPVAWASSLALVAAIGVLSGRYLRPSPEPSHSMARFTLSVGPAEESARNVAISSDGKYIAYIAGPAGFPKIYLRDVADRESRVISELPGGGNVFFSPDSQWCAFFETGKLKKISVHGGSSIALADASAPRGGTWGADGSIVFAPVARGGLMWLPPSGGSPETLTTPDPTRNENSHRWPSFLGDTRTVVFDAENERGGSALIAVSLETKVMRVLLKTAATVPRYVSTGHLAYRDGNKLVAVPFDLKTVAVTGPPASLLAGVDSFAFSSDGTLVYSAAEPGQAQGLLVWAKRDGTVDPLPLPPGLYQLPRISPDGTRIVFYGADRSLWLYDVPRGTMARYTFAYENWPLWTPDGKKIIYGSNRTGTQWDIFSKGADGNTVEQPLVSRQLTQIPRAISPDGNILVFDEADPVSALTLMQMPMRENAAASPLFEKSSGEMMPSFSPDGRWFAYVSSQTGRNEIYVRSFGSTEGKWQITNGGGVEPVWSAAGNELFYRSGDKMLAVDVQQSPSFSFGKSRELFSGAYTFGGVESQNYDVSRDGRRFLMVKRDTTGDANPPLNIIVNWFSELKERVPR
jgi:serine/threonine protein kinase